MEAGSAAGPRPAQASISGSLPTHPRAPSAAENPLPSSDVRGDGCPSQPSPGKPLRWASEASSLLHPAHGAAWDCLGAGIPETAAGRSPAPTY